LVNDPVVDRLGIQAAFDEVFDQAIVFHGFTDYMRDYDVFVFATPDPRSAIAPKYLRYRFIDWCDMRSHRASGSVDWRST
jgi:hypothetical protein